MKPINFLLSCHIALVGLMGSGKSNLSRQLESILGCPRIDTDEYIEAQQGISTSEIFSNFGEKHFRKLETEALEQILAESKDPTVISTGGGILLNADARELLLTNTYMVWLKADIETLESRLATKTQTRPLLVGKDIGQVLQKMLDERRKYYELAPLHFQVGHNKPLFHAQNLVSELANQGIVIEG